MLGVMIQEFLCSFPFPPEHLQGGRCPMSKGEPADADENLLCFEGPGTFPTVTCWNPIFSLKGAGQEGPILNQCPDL